MHKTTLSPNYQGIFFKLQGDSEFEIKKIKKKKKKKKKRGPYWWVGFPKKKKKNK